LAGPEGGADRLREDCAVDDAGDRRAGEVGDQLVDGQGTQTLRALVRAAGLRGERLARRLSGRQLLLVEGEGAALDDRSLEEPS